MIDYERLGRLMAVYLYGVDWHSGKESAAWRLHCRAWKLLRRLGFNDPQREVPLLLQRTENFAGFAVGFRRWHPVLLSGEELGDRADMVTEAALLRLRRRRSR